MKRVIATLGLAVTLAAGAGAQPSNDMAKEKAALMRTDTEFSDAAQKIGVGEAFVRYADESATMLPAGENPVKGLAGVRKQFADFPKGATLVWKPYEADVARSGDLGYTLGTYQSRGTGPDGKPVTRYGKYCSVWKKQKDGSWKWVVDVGTPSPEPGGADRP
jgi:ketosteroid isomerase-like protein